MNKPGKAASAAGSLYKKGRKPKSTEEEKTAIGAMLKANDDATKSDAATVSNADARAREQALRNGWGPWLSRFPGIAKVFSKTKGKK